MSEKKLVLIGSTVNPVHIKNFYNLVKDYFDDVLIIGTNTVDFCNSKSINFSLKNPLKVAQSIKELREILVEYNPTIIHVHQANSIAFITSLANNKRFPQVLTTWGDDVLINPYRSKLHRFITSFSIKKSDRITADAKSMMDSIHNFYGKIPVEILNFGIDLDTNPTIQKENIIYSNRLHNDLYNIDKIITGCVPFLNQHPDWKLIIAATGDNTEYLKDLAANSSVADQIEFVGFLNAADNKANYFKAKIYVSIPNTDGTAMSLLESLAYGCIPVVSDLPSNKEWVTNGVNGIINVSTLSNSINEALQLDYNKVASINKTIIYERATKDANRKGFIRIYEELINQ